MSSFVTTVFQYRQWCDYTRPRVRLNQAQGEITPGLGGDYTRPRGRLHQAQGVITPGPG